MEISKRNPRPKVRVLSSLLASDVTVQSRMTVGAKRYEIIFLVVPELASELNVMYLKVSRGTAMLATPAIAI